MARVRRFPWTHPDAEERDKRAGYKFDRFSVHPARPLEARGPHHALCFHPEHCKRPTLRPRGERAGVKGSNKFLIQLEDLTNTGGRMTNKKRGMLAGRTPNWAARFVSILTASLKNNRRWGIYGRTTNEIVPWKIYGDPVESIFERSAD